jgi:hypothetical protein
VPKTVVVKNDLALAGHQLAVYSQKLVAFKEEALWHTREHGTRACALRCAALRCARIDCKAVERT